MKKIILLIGIIGILLISGCNNTNTRLGLEEYEPYGYGTCERIPYDLYIQEHGSIINNTPNLFYDDGYAYVCKKK